MIAALLAYGVSAAVNGLFAGVAHDEGVTVEISVGQLREDPHRPLPVRELYDLIDGTTPRSAGEVINELSGPFKNAAPPAYYLLMRGWTELVGVHRVTLRLPSLAFGIVALLGLARLARRLVPIPGSGVWIVLLAALSPWFVTIMTFARPYALTMAVAVWSTVVTLAIADDRRRLASRVLFLLLSLLGLYTLYHYGFVLAWQLTYLAFVAWRAGPGRRWRELASLLLLGATLVVGYLPWLPSLLRHLQLTENVQSYFHGSLTEAAGFLNLVRTFMFGDALDGFGRDLHFWVLGALGLVTVALIVRAWCTSARHAEDEPASLMMRTFIIYPALIVVADALHGTRTLTLTKLSMLLFPFLLLFILRVWLAIPSRRGRVLGMVVWAMLLVSATVTSVRNKSGWLDHHQAVAGSIAASDDERHVVVLNSTVRGHAIPLLLTLQEHGVEHVSIMHCPPNLLAVTVEKLCKRKDQRITLVSMHTVYVWAPRAMKWTPEQLRLAAQHARRARWTVRRFEPKQLLDREQPAENAGRFEIIATVH